MSISRKEIGKGIFFTGITDKRYKTNRITIHLITTLDGAASGNAIFAHIADKANASFPDQSEFSLKLGELYGTDVSGIITKIGNSQIISLSASFIASKFAFEGEDLKLEAAKILRDCLLSPVTENGIFQESGFEIEKNNLIDDIDADLNEKRIYSVNRAKSIMFEGEPCSLHKLGTKEAAQALTAKTAWSDYKNLLSTAQIEIMFVGCEEWETVCGYFAKELSKLSRGEITEKQPVKTKIKAETKNVTERLKVAQSKMVLGFKTEFEDNEALRMLSSVYGATPTSKLFMNVREKLSLCYYCISRYDRFTKSIIVECGVENDNIEKARDEILRQLELIKNGEFDENEILSARLAVKNSLKTVSDLPSTLEAWYLSQIYAQTSFSPEEVFERTEKITKEQISQAAKSLVLDTVYVLTGEE